MIKRRVVLVLGAGASMPYGFPSGETLTSAMVDHLTRPTKEDMKAAIRRGILSHNMDAVDFQTFGIRLRDSPVSSVDAFLQVKANEQFRDVAKGAVAWLIARYENGTCAVTKPDDHWLRYLFAKLFDGTKAPEVRNNRVTIVTFNFDRVVEWHWREAVVSMYGISGSELEKRPQAGTYFVKAKQREDVRWLLD